MDLNHFSDYKRLNYQIFTIRLISETSELGGMKNFSIQNRVLQRDRVLQRCVLERYYCIICNLFTGGAKCKETAADCCWLLLTAADCCWLLLTAADCCWLLQSRPRIARAIAAVSSSQQQSAAVSSSQQQSAAVSSSFWQFCRAFQQFVFSALHATCLIDIVLVLQFL